MMRWLLLSLMCLTMGLELAATAVSHPPSIAQAAVLQTPLPEATPALPPRPTNEPTPIPPVYDGAFI